MMLRNSTRTIKVLLFQSAICLSTLALLAGCKSGQPITALKTGYLYFNDDMVMFVEWGHTGQRLEGLIEACDRMPDGAVWLQLYQLDGALDGENVSMTVNQNRAMAMAVVGSSHYVMGTTITGTLRGNTLALPPANGAPPVEFRCASRDEFFAAYQNLKSRAEKKGAK